MSCRVKVVKLNRQIRFIIFIQSNNLIAMADISVENNETPVVEKEVEEADAPKVAETEDAVATTENGSSEVTENGTAAAPTTTTETPAEEASEEATADEPAAAETNGDSVTSEALKRKSTVGDAAAVTEESAVDGDEATPEKKAKLDEVAAEDSVPEVVAESEAAEVAA